MGGLDPPIHFSNTSQAESLDQRVKPADGELWEIDIISKIQCRRQISERGLVGRLQRLIPHFQAIELI